MLVFALSLQLLLLSEVAARSRRVALVIGNSSYQHTAALANPANDARDIGAALRQLDFEVIEGIDLSIERMRARLIEFRDAMHDAEVGLLFYAGHGIQFGGKNYLVPIDARLSDVTDIGLRLLELDAVLELMETKTSIRIVLLDACRDNPCSEEMASKMPSLMRRQLARGLAQLSGNSGTFIAFATKPGDVALDGAGASNSPFSGALKLHISREGLRISDVMLDVRREVVNATNRRQVPWDMSSLIEPFFFKRASTSPPVAQLTSADDSVRIVWKEVTAANQVEIYREFQKAFPASIYSRLAEGHIEQLRGRAARSEHKAGGDGNRSKPAQTAAKAAPDGKERVRSTRAAATTNDAAAGAVP